MGLRCVALFTLVAHRSCDGRNSDLAVARVEVGVLPGGVFLLLRCFHTHNPNSVSFLARPHGPNVTTYWGRIARQIVCCCDICYRLPVTSVRTSIGPAMVNPALRSWGLCHFLIRTGQGCTAAFLQQDTGR